MNDDISDPLKYAYPAFEGVIKSSSCFINELHRIKYQHYIDQLCGI